MEICFKFKVGGIFGKRLLFEWMGVCLTFKVEGIWKKALVRVDGNIFTF